MSTRTTALNILEAIYKLGWASKKLGYPIEECPYRKCERERSIWLMGYRDAENADKKLSVFDCIPMDGDCWNGSCNP